MTNPSDFSYRDALKSFESIPAHGVTSICRKLFRVILEIGQAEGISQKQIAKDISDRLKTDRDTIADKLSACVNTEYLQNKLPMLSLVKQHNNIKDLTQQTF